MDHSFSNHTKTPRKSPIRKQPTPYHLPRKLPIQHIIIQIHSPEPVHKFRDPPHRRAALRQRDRIAHLRRVQRQPSGTQFEIIPFCSQGRVPRVEVRDYVVGGKDEVGEGVGEGDALAESLEFDGDGGVWDAVDVGCLGQGAGGVS